MTFASTEPAALRDSALHAADRIGARLVRDAIRDGRRATWLGDHMEPINNQWSVALKPAGTDVYSGTPGIAMFLARLHAATGERLFAVTADAAVEHFLSQLESIPAGARPALWSGWAGIAWALLDIGAAMDRSAWTERGLAIADNIADLDPVPGMLDVMTGSAGVIPFLLRLHRQHGRQSALDAALRHGELLLTSARRSDRGCSWQTMPHVDGQENRDLNGLSHGAAGIALALFELAQATGDARFADAGAQGIDYEQQWFSPHHNNWPDFREMMPNTPQEQWGYSATWCHGAPGIALARARVWQLTGKPEYRAQAEAALRTTMMSVETAAPASGSWCLCHGTAGNADVLLAGSEMLGDPSWSAAARQAAIRGIETYEQGDLPWPPGVTGGIDNPSLMLGNAGTGWFFLRLAFPETVKSVLIFGDRT
jgi:lantibiotic modifying enzyme